MGKINLNDIKKESVVIVEPDFTYIDGAYLRSFRMKMKMSQALFADYLGVSKKAIEKWEQGRNKVNPVIARIIYLMENDSKIFSLLKRVKIADKVFEIKPIASFNPVEITNDTQLTQVGIDYDNSWNYQNKWEYNNGSVGGFNNVQASI